MKKLIKICSLLLVLLMVFTLCACSEEPEEKSILTGTFTMSKSLDNVKIKHQVQSVNYGQYFYALKSPYNSGLENDSIRYGYDTTQTLKVKKDFSYSYTYQVDLSVFNDWGNNKFATLTVSAYGKYEYEKIGNNYLVSLGVPTSGSLNATSFKIEHFSWGYNLPWGISIHGAEDYSIDFTLIEDLKANDVGQFVCDLSFSLDRENKEILDGDIFHPYVFDFVSEFSTIEEK
ncbi:MAG: hypothetical protein E7369_01945 [Clostridiales bacterium]|nr:hypothetical protein [Clostridiales bacterium]